MAAMAAIFKMTAHYLCRGSLLMILSTVGSVNMGKITENIVITCIYLQRKGQSLFPKMTGTYKMAVMAAIHKMAAYVKLLAA